MKRNLLLVFSIATLLAGCQGNRSGYLAEKEFYQASKKLAALKKVEAMAGVTVHEARTYVPVITAFEEIVEKYPSSSKAIESLSIIADLWAKQKAYDRARETLNKIVQNYSSTLAADARFKIAQLYEAEGKWEKAEAAYWETAEYHPLVIKGAYAPIYITGHYKKEGNQDAFERSFVKASEYYNTNLKQAGPIEASVIIHNYLALAYVMHGDWQKAKDEWLLIAKNYPKNPYAPLGILAAAETISANGKFEDGLRLYRRFFRTYPSHPFVGKSRVRIGLMYLAKRDFARSRWWLNKAISENFAKDNAAIGDLKLLIGRAFQEEGLWAEAQKVYDEIGKEHPTTVASLQVPFMVSLYYEQQNQPEKVEEILDEAIKQYELIEKEHPGTRLAKQARRFMYNAFAKKGDWDKFLANVDQDIVNEKNSVIQGRWLLLKGLIAENRLKDKEKAVTLYQDFLQKHPEHPQANVAKSHLEALSKN
ncbi:MAG: tetratricopeptide repeat protein [Candidatus Omnitrophica bacterium]|nr:tetratricopeptide repeat protein [Candidatus Omnitrophota bacterium]